MDIKKVFSFVILSLLAFSVISCSKNNCKVSQSSTLAQNSNKFAIEFYKKAAQNSNENIFFSPYSIYTAFGMLFEGTANNTTKEFTKVFGFYAQNTKRWETIKSDLSKYQDKNKEYGVFIANSLWSNRNIELSQLYKETLKNYYFAEVRSLDFSKDAAVDTMNRWVSDNTAERIKDIISYGQVNTNTPFVLINTVYFKDKWLIPFDKKMTKKEKFTLADATEIEAALMFKKDEYLYYENKNVQAIKLMYESADSRTSMIIVLPVKNDVSKAEKFIYENTIEDINEKFAFKNGMVYLPKFEMNWKADVSMLIKSMGIKTSDYSKISDMPVAISNVLHSSFIKVDEEETEAAAATAIIAKMSMPIEKEPPFIFRADHPFVYMIVDESDNKVLFMGKMHKPESKGK